jgi:Tol biopolymer transport system component
MNPDGTEQQNLTNNPANDGEGSWSPDGTKMVFESDRDGNLEIYTTNFGNYR